MIETVAVELASGPVAVRLIWDRSPRPDAVVILAHGAGAGPEHPFLAGFAASAARGGVDVVRFPFPYVVAGRRMPGPAAHAVATWAAVTQAVAAAMPGVPLVAAGKSYGGRMASMAAAEGVIEPAALVYLGYPLHPPGRPDRPRAEHLPRIVAPQLFVSGTLDPFVDPLVDLDAAVSSCRDGSQLRIEGARHSFEVAGPRLEPAVIGAELAPGVLAWIRARSID
ncbi:alpha/beta hydrolase family protein [Microbacterium oleivorans]|uniref:Dienelactone hydrolase n=1 Tax=Microbacterium oleivorans TaxID=273677 RepID=A0A7D5JX21_9MICO|nr:alpha/beta family hydrolase [Microbacterium oleivorans]QLD10563.1 dienelactone hydrolase [Microbacterium oleivorans]